LSHLPSCRWTYHAVPVTPLCSRDTAPTATHTLSLHDALPICRHVHRLDRAVPGHPEEGPALDHRGVPAGALAVGGRGVLARRHEDRKSTRLNSSHVSISYAVFCLKKKIDK